MPAPAGIPVENSCSKYGADFYFEICVDVLIFKLVWGSSCRPMQPPHINHPPTNPQQQYSSSTAALQQQYSSAAVRTAVHRYAMIMWLVLQSHEGGKKRGDAIFVTTLRYLGGMSEAPTTKHTPLTTYSPTHRPQQCNRSTGVQHYVPTNSQRQHSSAAAHSTAVHLERVELGGDFHFLTMFRLPGD